MLAKEIYSMMSTNGSTRNTINLSMRRKRYLGDIVVIVLGLLGLFFVLKARADNNGTTTTTTLTVSPSSVTAAKSK
jgi:hypothetical protein